MELTFYSAVFLAPAPNADNKPSQTSVTETKASSLSYSLCGAIETPSPPSIGPIVPPAVEVSSVAQQLCGTSKSVSNTAEAM